MRGQPQPASGSSIPADVRGRLLRGITASTLSPFVTAAIQLGSVPLLLHAWGPAKYGDWLILSAIPSYLTLTDLGFGDASGSDMTVKVASGDREGALATFQSSWMLLNVLSIAVLAIVASAVWWPPWQRWLHLSSVASGPAASTIALLALYVVVSQQGGILESGYRCDGNYAAGTSWATVIRLIEAAAACCVGLATGRFLWMAASYLALRVVWTLWYERRLRKLSPWLCLGIRHARFRTVRKLALPAGAFVALPLGYALSFQGFTILIGATLGPLAVTAFSTLRTLSRVGVQFVSAISYSVWPELSRAIGTGDLALARVLHQRSLQVTAFTMLLATLGLWLFGPFAYAHWVRKTVAFNPLCFHLLLAASVAAALWSANSVVTMSANTHHHIAIGFLLITALSIAALRFELPRFGIVGASGMVLAGDLTLICIALRGALAQLREPLPEFIDGLCIVRS